MGEFDVHSNISSQFLTSSSSLLHCSQYAAVATVYPSGEWYGQLTARNAATILTAYVNAKNKNDLCPNYRGKMVTPLLFQSIPMALLNPSVSYRFRPRLMNQTIASWYEMLTSAQLQQLYINA